MFQVSRAYKCHGPATAQSFAEFVQNLYMCTLNVEKSLIFTIKNACLTPLMCLFNYFLRISWRRISKSKVFTAQENQLLESLQVLCRQQAYLV